LLSHISASASSRARYSSPDGSYTAAPAPLWRRGSASAIDWTIAGVGYLLFLIPAGIVEALGRTVGGSTETVLFVAAQAVALSVLVGYFTGMLASGHTMGMRTLDIHVVAAGSGREPSRWRSLARSLLALTFAVAAINAYAYFFSFSSDFTPFERLVAAVAVPVAAIAVAGQFWMLLDRSGRTLWDRLTGIAVVEDIVPTSMPDRLWSPWGT
jgi:uncharacterized RDD family membrane protein YckC